MAEWQYKVVALPRDVAVMKKVFGGPDPKDVVAGYLERIIEAEAQQGWEFYRIDTVNILNSLVVRFTFRSKGDADGL